jgi:23S rRNA (pseudouridine1915-N3)-methyltransferase
MRIRLLTITHKTPAWIQEGYDEYAKRLRHSCTLELVEIPAEKRTANTDLPRLLEREGEKMLAALKPRHHVIALDVKGASWSTEQLATQLADWYQQGKNIDLLIGGPDGLARECLKKAQQRWSLSPLTFPHLFIRIMIAEQIYRASSILEGHPYHRQ